MTRLAFRTPFTSSRTQPRHESVRLAVSSCWPEWDVGWFAASLRAGRPSITHGRRQGPCIPDPTSLHEECRKNAWVMWADQPCLCDDPSHGRTLRSGAAASGAESSCCLLYTSDAADE